MQAPRPEVTYQFAQAIIDALVIGATVLLAKLAHWFAFRKESTEKMIHDAGEMGLRIAVLLAELGVKLGADRAFLAQFHNGDHYVSGSDLLRKSRTHEWTRASVSRTVDYQNVLVSLVHTECELIEEPGPSFRRVEEIDHGQFRAILESQGVKAIARCAVRQNGDIVGFIGVDFLRVQDKPPERIDELTFYAARIEQVLLRGRK